MKINKLKKPKKPLKPRIPTEPQKPIEFLSPFPIHVDMDDLLNQSAEEELILDLYGIEDKLFELLKTYLKNKTGYVSSYGPNFIDKLSKSEISFGRDNSYYCSYSYVLTISGENLINHIKLQKYAFYEKDFKIYQRKMKKYEVSKEIYRLNLIEYEKDFKIYENSLKEYKKKINQIEKFAESLK
jgi:hypothetical protein